MYKLEYSYTEDQVRKFPEFASGLTEEQRAELAKAEWQRDNGIFEEVKGDKALFLPELDGIIGENLKHSDEEYDLLAMELSGDY